MADRGKVDSGWTGSESALKRMKVEGRVSEVTPASKRVIDVVIRRVDSAVLLARLQRGSISHPSPDSYRIASEARPARAQAHLGPSGRVEAGHMPGSRDGRSSGPIPKAPGSGSETGRETDRSPDVPFSQYPLGLLLLPILSPARVGLLRLANPTKGPQACWQTPQRGCRRSACGHVANHVPARYKGNKKKGNEGHVGSKNNSFDRVTANDKWPAIGTAMGFPSFSAGDPTQLLQCAPNIAHSLQQLYNNSLRHFKQAIIHNVIDPTEELTGVGVCSGFPVAGTVTPTNQCRLSVLLASIPLHMIRSGTRYWVTICSTRDRRMTRQRKRMEVTKRRELMMTIEEDQDGDSRSLHRSTYTGREVALKLLMKRETNRSHNQLYDVYFDQDGLKCEGERKVQLKHKGEFTQGRETDDVVLHKKSSLPYKLVWFGLNRVWDPQTGNQTIRFEPGFSKPKPFKTVWVQFKPGLGTRGTCGSVHESDVNGNSPNGAADQKVHQKLWGNHNGSGDRVTMTTPGQLQGDGTRGDNGNYNGHYDETTTMATAMVTVQPGSNYHHHGNGNKVLQCPLETTGHDS
ncbi:hypothetical protein EDB85DRAFT_1898135 [Lactarius pseudohatsudake]|nr:hypothetical protein EDB85DRAFT_1898135 [Lactarius pseudohatsudake]